MNNSIRLDLRFVVILLLLVIVGLLAYTKPWEARSKKTVSVTGEGTVNAAPDQFTFSPTYEKKAVDSKESIKQVSEIGNGVVAKLKELGVKAEDLKTTVNTNPSFDPIPLSDSTDSSIRKPSSFGATYSITASVYDKKSAQAILDYLVTTPVLYGVSPQSTFRKETKTKLEAEARQKSLSDARAKAEQTVTGLGARLGAVESVSDLQQYGGPIILEDKVVSGSAIAPIQSSTTPILETGTQDLTFSVTVVYRIK